MGELIVRAASSESNRTLASRLKARAPELCCRICGGNDFALLEHADAGSPFPPRRPPVETSLSRPLDRRAPLTLACSNCGRLRELSWPVLDGSALGERVRKAV